MRVHLHCLLVVLTTVAIGAGSAKGQDRPTTTRKSTVSSLFSELQDRIMGGILGPVAEPAYPPRSAEAQRAESRAAISRHARTSRTRTMLPEYSRSGSASSANRRVMVARSPGQTARPAVPVAVSEAALPAQRSVAPASIAPGRSGSLSRLYERLSAARQSSFGDSSPAVRDEHSPQAEPAAAVPRAVEAETRPAAGPSTDAVPTVVSRRQPWAPTTVRPQPKPTIAGQSLPAAGPLARPGEAIRPAPAVSRPIAEKPLPVAGAENVAAGPSRTEPTPAIPAEAQPRVLFVGQSPVLNVKTIGPPRIDVGHESVYRVVIGNSGQAEADQLVVGIDFPSWADVLGAEVSVGATTTARTADGTQRFQWKIGRLAAGSEETLVLRVVPRESRPFDLAVVWNYTPAAAEAKIEVQEAKLAIKLHGPDQILYGKQETFRLEIANTGTGEARQVAITLLPLGSGQSVPATHPLGTLAAGEKKVVEIELTARQAGNLRVNIDATAAGGVQAHLAQEVIVLRPALAVKVDAPEFQFVGNEVTYRIDVSNPGTATAEGVALVAHLPQGFEYISSQPEGTLSAADGKIAWSLAGLPAKKNVAIELVGRLGKEGAGELQLVCSATDGLNARAEASVRVEAIADLALQTTDPAGPVPVGSEAVYEVKVVNRGSKQAEGVEVTGYFSDGIEPIQAEGGKHRLAPGQVVFEPLKTLGPGQSHVFKIKARAATAGNLIFRAEVYCQPLGTRLVSEETTHYYGRSHAKPAHDGILTADRRDASGGATPVRGAADGSGKSE